VVADPGCKNRPLCGHIKPQRRVAPQREAPQREAPQGKAWPASDCVGVCHEQA